ncbi:MAG: hypothetical protein J6L69_10685 [Lachnospiraceae bacterium]|nr:hypothetical protein [Lachnospiraceae bacterium]
MSNTIFYNGNLKKKHSVDELYEIIIEYIESISWTYNFCEEGLIVDFNDKSEKLCFLLKENRLSGFCKNLSTKDELFYQIFDLFLKIKPMFSKLDVSDDIGLWNDYIASKKPCEIIMRPLTVEEKEYVENFDKDLSCEQVLYRIIYNDINKNDNKAMAYEYLYYQYLLDNINPNVYNSDPEVYDGIIGILETWIYESMEYKNYGKVCEIDKNIKGLKNALLTFQFAIAETVFGYWGGTFDSKHSQIRKLYKEEIESKKVSMDQDFETMYRFVLSVLDYLGFKR